MKGRIEERCQIIGRYIIENQCTVRAAAERFYISKSTVHKDVSERLIYYNRRLYDEVQEVLAQNKSERHIRGGEATKRKYQK